MSTVKIIIGFLLIIFNKPIANIIEWGDKSHLPWQKKTKDGTRKKAELPG